MNWDMEQHLIVKKQTDGSMSYGDAFADTMRYYHLLKIREFLGISNANLVFNTRESVEFSFHKCLSIIDGDWYLSRAPLKNLPKEWPNPFTDFPADQFLPGVMALGAWGLDDLLKHLEEEYKTYYPNGQPILGDGRGIILRSMHQKSNNWWDMFPWGTVMARVGWLPTWDSGIKSIQWGVTDDVEDDINLFHLFATAEMRGHTWMSQHAMKTYFKKRDVEKAFEIYFDDRPFFFDLYEPTILSLKARYVQAGA